MCQEDTPADQPTQNEDAPAAEPAAAPAAEAAAEEQAPAGKATISYDDFCKLDLRVATIVEVAEHPNADKLLVLQLDLAGERRQLVAGIKSSYTPEALLGRQIVVVANLAPRKLRGMESNGMLLAATGPDGPVILTTEREVPSGAAVS